MTTTESVRINGYAICRSVLPSEALAGLREALEIIPDQQAVAGKRNLLQMSPAIRELALSPGIRALITPILGPGAIPVRAISFDKTPEHNWPVMWHQDRTISVRERVDIPGFGPWSVKEGIQHVQPPVDILESMLTVRVHLDPADESNGALRVVSGTHTKGLIPESLIPAILAEEATITCGVEAGDAMLMRPLLLHCSKRSTNPNRRRVIHIEYGSRCLPEPLGWHEEMDPSPVVRSDPFPGNLP